ncbi:hypothetical protein N326_04865, partial [Eurypyga helias]
LLGIALGQTATTQVPVASSPVLPGTATTQVPIASSPVPPGTATTASSAPPTASASVPAGVASTTPNLVASTMAPSAGPSTKQPAQTLPVPMDVTVLTPGSTATSQASPGPMAASTS